MSTNRELIITNQNLVKQKPNKNSPTWWSYIGNENQSETFWIYLWKL